jgi:hypothetical protein
LRATTWSLRDIHGKVVPGWTIVPDAMLASDRMIQRSPMTDPAICAPFPM